MNIYFFKREQTPDLVFNLCDIRLGHPGFPSQSSTLRGPSDLAYASLR